MTEAHLQDPMSELGYVFDSGTRVVGHTTMTVTFLPTPTEQHYDPERMHVPCVTLAGDVIKLTILHPWFDRSDWRVAPGIIALLDRKDKVVEAFTFGATLHIHTDELRTRCVFQSPAPIFEVKAGIRAGALDATSIFVEEVESRFARIHAAWNGDDAGFAQRLAATDPVMLYAACRLAVRAHLSRLPESLRLTRYRSTLHLLRVMEIQDPVPSYVAPLDEMLQPTPIVA